MLESLLPAACHTAIFNRRAAAMTSLRYPQLWPTKEGARMSTYRPMEPAPAPGHQLRTPLISRRSSQVVPVMTAKALPSPCASGLNLIFLRPDVAASESQRRLFAAGAAGGGG